MEGCERALPADGMLRAMFPFVLDEWATWERTGQRPLVDPLPPAELLPDPANPTGPQDLVVVQGPDAMDVLELARQAEASDLGVGTLEMVDRTVDRFCRDYPTAPPAVLIPRVQQRLGYLTKLLKGKVTLAQHRQLLVASGWLTTLLACLQFDYGDLVDLLVWRLLGSLDQPALLEPGPGAHQRDQVRPLTARQRPSAA